MTNASCRFRDGPEWLQSYHWLARALLEKVGALAAPRHRSHVRHVVVITSSCLRPLPFYATEDPIDAAGGIITRIQEVSFSDRGAAGIAIEVSLADGIGKPQRLDRAKAK